MTFEQLENGYPAWIRPSDGPGCGWSGFKNHCAMRVSEALRNAGFPLARTSYSDPLCTLNGAKLATGAESLAKHLDRHFKMSEKGVLEQHLKGRRGIIFFLNIRGFNNGSSGPDGGDHIDIWDGVGTRSGAYFDRAQSTWFWELP